MTHLLQPGGEAHDMGLHLLQAGLHSALETCKSPAVTTAHDSALKTFTWSTAMRQAPQYLPAWALQCSRWWRSHCIQGDQSSHSCVHSIAAAAAAPLSALDPNPPAWRTASPAASAAPAARTPGWRRACNRVLRHVTVELRGGREARPPSACCAFLTATACASLGCCVMLLRLYE